MWSWLRDYVGTILHNFFRRFALYLLNIYRYFVTSKMIRVCKVQTFMNNNFKYSTPHDRSALHVQLDLPQESMRFVQFDISVYRFRMSAFNPRNYKLYVNSSVKFVWHLIIEAAMRYCNICLHGSFFLVNTCCYLSLCQLKTTGSMHILYIFNGRYASVLRSMRFCSRP